MIKSIIRRWLGIDASVDGILKELDDQKKHMRREVVECIDELTNEECHPSREVILSKDRFSLYVKRITIGPAIVAASEEANLITAKAMADIASESFIDSVIDRINRKKLI